MDSDSARNVEYILPSTEAESRRLEVQAGLYGGGAFLEPHLAARPARVLEVGCGTGVFCAQAARRLPDSQIVGLDQDAGRLAFARAHNAAENLAYRAGNLTALPFEDASFDLVYCRFVLIHATDPTHALSEMARVTRPGGAVLAYEMVHDGIWFSPAKPAFAALLREVLAVMRSRGMEPSQGLHLAPAMIRAGLRAVRAEVIPHGLLSADPPFERYRQNWIDTLSGLDQILGARVDAGLLASALAELAVERPDQFLLELTVLASGTR
jgi:SAM-dependent methyltransferase